MIEIVSSWQKNLKRVVNFKILSLAIHGYSRTLYLFTFSVMLLLKFHNFLFKGVFYLLFNLFLFVFSLALLKILMFNILSNRYYCLELLLIFILIFVPSKLSKFSVIFYIFFCIFNRTNSIIREYWKFISSLSILIN